jgi:anti-sigma factor RsiW
MTTQDDTTDMPIERLLRALESFDLAEEVREMLAPRGEHPAACELEQYAADDLDEEARQLALASHIETCASCRAEVNELRALLAPLAHRPLQAAAVPPRAVSQRFLVPMAAAAAGGTQGRRSGQGVAVHVIEPPGMEDLRVVAIQFDDSARCPGSVSVRTLAGVKLTQDHLPPPDSRGVIQFTRSIASPDDQAFLELLLTAPLEFE